VSALVVVLVIVVLAAIVVGAMWLVREREKTSIESTMRDFQRGLEALDPENDPLKNPRNQTRRGRR
jgi:FtsZ-interacting cell division protein ZipA